MLGETHDLLSAIRRSSSAKNYASATPLPGPATVPISGRRPGHLDADRAGPTPAALGAGGADQTAGSISMSMLAAPLSGTRGWRHTSTGNEAFTSE